MIEASKINIVTNPRNMFFNPKKAKDHMPLKKSCKKKAMVPELCIFFFKTMEEENTKSNSHKKVKNNPNWHKNPIRGIKNWLI